MTNLMRASSLILMLFLFTPSGRAAQIRITFDDAETGQTLASQYQHLGVTFSNLAFVGQGGPTGNWATNSDLTIVDINSTDVGTLGIPSLVSGNIVRTVSGWLLEDGDASILISFSFPIYSFSLDFAGIDAPSSTGLYAYGQGQQMLLSSVFASSAGQQNLRIETPGIEFIIVQPGDFDDWVSFDNLSFETDDVNIPEPNTAAYFLIPILAIFFIRTRTQLQLTSDFSGSFRTAHKALKYTRRGQFQFVRISTK